MFPSVLAESVAMKHHLLGQAANSQRKRCIVGHLKRANRGAQVTIEMHNADGSATEMARDVPLTSLALDEKSDGCNDLFVIEAGLPNARHVRHLIVEPIHLRLRDGDNERYNHLEVVGEN